MDKRKKLSDTDIKKIHRLLKQGVKGEAIMQLMGISSTHFYRIQQAYRNGEVNLKRTSLHSISHFVASGLPFKRIAWKNHLYYYYDTEQSWFVKHRCMFGKSNDYEVIEYTLNLSLQDLLAKDWVALTWESVR
jgi:hypothetical protein